MPRDAHPDEHDLRESEEKFRALAEGSPDAIMRFDRAHRHLYVNPAVARFVAIPREAFLGRTHRELGFPQHLVELWEQAIDRVFASGLEHRVEFMLPGDLWIDWQLMPETSEDGEVHGVMTWARDITARKLAEAVLARDRDELERLVELRTGELRASQARLHALLEDLPVGVFRCDPEGRILEANTAAVALFGFDSLARLQRVRVTELGLRWPPASAQPAELELQALDGRRSWVRVCPRAVLDGGREVVHDCVLVDISQSKRQEERLRYLGSHDVLTGLANRARFEEELARLAREGPFPIDIVVADVDGLKDVNDGRGHAAGDDVLRQAAELLRRSFRPGDLVARVGGDEFVVLVPGADGVMGEAMVARVRERCSLASRRRHDSGAGLGLSLGLASAPDGAALHEALRLADARMYEEKARRRSPR